MGNQQIVQKLWNLCNVLRDDGITYHQYVTELTYLLFLKMMKETGNEDAIPEHYRWDSLTALHGLELKTHYQKLLIDLGNEGNDIIKQIYTNAGTNIDEPKNLEKIVRSIDELDWYSAKEEGLGDLYEGLLEKNASETKSGAGQYFTPRVLIDIIVKLVNPQPGERCNDPAAGTFGFMIAADRHVREQTDDYFDLGEKEADFQRKQAFTGVELVRDTHRLALMNAMLHDLQGEIILGDTLSDLGKDLKNFDVILTNPPFGTKQGRERPTRDDLTFTSTNKQLNFLQHIYRALKPDGKARAAVVLPDNVLFEGGIGAKIREDLMNKCNLHTILRLPTGIFYAQGVKTNVLFFTRGKTDTDNTKDVWVYDLRTNMPSFGKRTPLTEKHFEGFVEAYEAEDRASVKDERFNVFTREDIKKKDNSLDIGLIADESMSVYENLPDPIDSAEEAIGNLEQAIGLLNEVVVELRKIEVKKLLPNQLRWVVMSKIEKKRKTVEEFLERAIVSKEEHPYEVPDNWLWTTADTVCDVRDGTHDSPKYKAEGYPLITSKNLKNGRLDFSNVNFISEEDHIAIGKRSKVNEQDILFAMIGTIGNPVLIDVKEEDFSIKNVALFKPNQRIIDSKYLYRYLGSPQYLEPLKNNAKGSTQKFVALGKLRKSFVPLPPINEQKRIADKVERLLNKIDEAKRLIDEAKETFELHWAAILEKAFRGELTMKWRNNSQSSNTAEQFLDKMGGPKKMKSDPLDSNVLTNLYTLPKGWKWVRLNDIIDTSTYGTSSKTNENSDGTPVIRMGNISEGKLILDNLKYLPTDHADVKKLELEQYDLLFNRTNSYELVGKTGIVTKEIAGKATFASYLIRVRLHYKEILANYVCDYINSHIGRGMLLTMVTQQVGQANINSKKLAALPIPLPPEEEVKKITSLLRAFSEKGERVKEIQNLEDDIEILKQAVLSKAFRGELDTNDSTEESAIDLLKQVLEEKDSI